MQHLLLATDGSIGAEHATEVAATLAKAVDGRRVPGATHLFEEPGTLHKIVDLAVHWFNAHFEAATT